jgi:hypothetical protein
MIKPKKDRIKYYGITILFVILFIVLAGFYQKSSKLDKSEIGKYQVASLPSFAVSLKDNLFPDTPKSFVSPSETMNFSLFNDHFKILVDSKLTNQKLIFLNKIKLFPGSIPYQGFYYHYMSKDKGDLPILS